MQIVSFISNLKYVYVYYFICDNINKQQYIKQILKINFG